MNENELFLKLIESNGYRFASETIKAIHKYGNVDTLCVYFLPAEKRRKWFLCNQDGIGHRTTREYAKDCLRDAGHTAKSAELVLRASRFDPITTDDLLPV